ncbi:MULTISPECIES: hypothetical protein [unclassified Corynebacterium]
MSSAIQAAAETTPVASISPFTLDEYVSLFIYDGPSSPEILSSDLVTLIS